MYASIATRTADIPSSEDEECSTPVITTETIRAPFILSSVNRRWRAIALGQSTLWSNLCITAELIGEAVPIKVDLDQETFPFTSSQTLYTKQITYCLQRSRQASLNVFIDARDPEWNFAEAGVDAENSFIPEALFSPQHMNAFISLIVPHITRWKSLTILTDTWAPMHSALTTINPHITSLGAPLLETMTLMRCNDFISYSPQFQPPDLKEPKFLSHNCNSLPVPQSLLPKLKYLSLRGVHVDWDSLGDALAASANLLSLELTSHSADSINIGYRTTMEGRAVLKLLNAPNAKTLVLEDATYPGDPDDANGSPLLYYLGSKEFVGSGNDPSDAAEKGVITRDSKQPTTPRRRKSSVYSQNAELSSPQPAFPVLEKVVMKNVKSSSRSLRTLFNALPHLQDLELMGMSMSAVQALVPSPSPSASTSTICPCPRLNSFCIHDSEQLQVRDLNYIARDLATARQSWGACTLRVKIHVLDSAKAACVAAAASPDTEVNVISDDEGDGEDYMDIDPFKLGGAFNDPLFDEYYSDQIAAR
ncbi:hypothetical protein CPB84DRAFT_1747350 [Gymnopilus junonius]|uniref:F-box domain-containing protein n=1 Tax=Gymnopilus junonius TaxID=109634 RepID=A0A9P5TNV5_GYMJU|nr:hypothetical protein CPB84DRAFT_1747350 [Gymnopilus junonius]